MTGTGNDNSSEISLITKTLAVLAGCCVITVCVCSYMGLKIPPELNTLTGGLVGAITAILVKTTPTAATTLPPDITISGQPPKVTVTQPTEEKKV